MSEQQSPPSATESEPPQEASDASSMRGASIPTPSKAPAAGEGAQPSKEDLRFIKALREAGLLLDLGARELRRIVAQIESKSETGRRTRMLELYYTAEDDLETSARRVGTDRFFLFRDGAPVKGGDIVNYLQVIASELDDLRLERTAETPMQVFLCAGEQRHLVEDPIDDMDTGQVDLRELENGPPTIAIPCLVQALNRLMKEHGIKERLVELTADRTCETYVGLPKEEAIGLLPSGYLEAEDEQELMELAAW